jgi:RNA polymerase sigma-70 factor, ECF subfamily
LTSQDHEAEERLLVEEAQRDPSRFAGLYEAHFDRIYAFIARRVADRGAAEDLTSEVFHQALANLPRFEWRGAPFAAWLYRIAANAVAAHYRRRARERGTPAAELSVDDPDMAAAEGRARLMGLVRRLGEDQRRVVLMRFAEEKSLREIAAALGRSEGAVKQLQLRALRTLRARMSETHD